MDSPQQKICLVDHNILVEFSIKWDLITVYIQERQIFLWKIKIIWQRVISFWDWTIVVRKLFSGKNIYPSKQKNLVVCNLNCPPAPPTGGGKAKIKAQTQNHLQPSIPTETTIVGLVNQDPLSAALLVYHLTSFI